MANNKITKREYFAIVKGIVEGSKAKNKADIIAFLNHEVELLDKKSSNSKATPTQAANIVTLNVIKEVLADRDKPATITELLTDARLQFYTETTKDGEKIITMTNQKLSSLVKKLVDTKEVIKTYEKKKAYFSLSTIEEESFEDESEENIEEESFEDENFDESENFSENENEIEDYQLSENETME